MTESRPSDNLSICIVSGGDEVRSRSYVNQAIYAREFNLDYRLEVAVAPGVNNPYFYKSTIVRRMVPLYDWILWIDDDVYFTDFERDGVRELVDRAEAGNKFMVFAENPLEPNGNWSGFNAGVFMLKNDPRTFRFLDMIVEENLQRADDWWDVEKHGTKSGGDQDIQLWALHQLGLYDEALVVDHRELNSRWHYYPNSIQDAFLCHFCGHYDKNLSVALFGKRFGLGQELVPEHLLDKYSVQHRSPMSELEYRARFYRWHTVGFLKPYVKPALNKYRALKSRR